MITNFGLENRIAIITAARSGIGRAIAIGLSEAGAYVLPVRRNLSAFKEVREGVKGMAREILLIAGDISKEEDRVKIVKETVGNFGRIGIPVNKSAISPILKNAYEVNLKEWNEMK